MHTAPRAHRSTCTPLHVHTALRAHLSTCTPLHVHTAPRAHRSTDRRFSSGKGPFENSEDERPAFPVKGVRETDGDGLFRRATKRQKGWRRSTSSGEAGGKRAGPQPARRKKGWPKGVKRGPPKWRLKERRTGFKLNLYTPPETPMEPDRHSLPEEPQPAAPRLDPEPDEQPPGSQDPAGEFFHKPGSPLDPFSQDNADAPDIPGTDDAHQREKEQKAEEEQGCEVRAGEEEDEAEEPAHNEDHDADDEDDGHAAELETVTGNAAEACDDLPEPPSPCMQDADTDTGRGDGCQDDQEAAADGGQATRDREDHRSDSPRHPDSESEEECGREEGEPAGSPAREDRAVCAAEIDPETARAVQSLTGETERESGFLDCAETQEACRSLQGYTHTEQSPPAAPADEGLPSEHSSPVSSVHSHPGQSVRSVSSLEGSYTQISPAHSTVSAPSLQNLETSPMMDVPSVSDHSQQVADSGFSDLGSIESTTENYDNPSSYDSTLGAGSAQSSCSYGNLPQSSCAVTQQLAERAGVGGAYGLSSPQGCVSERPPSGHQPLSHFTLPPAPPPPVQLPEMSEPVRVSLGRYDRAGQAEYGSGHYTQPSATFSLAKLQQLTNGLMDHRSLPFGHPASHPVTSYANSAAPLLPPRHTIPQAQVQTMTPPPNLTPPPTMLQRNMATPNASVPPSPQRLQNHASVRAKSAPLPPHHHHHHLLQHQHQHQQQQVYGRAPQAIAMQAPGRTFNSPGRSLAMPRMNMGVNLMPAPAYNVNSMNMNVNMTPLNAMNGYRVTQPMMNSGYHGNHAYMNQSPQYSMQMGMMGTQPYPQQPMQAPPHGNMMYTSASHHGYINSGMSKPPLNPGGKRRRFFQNAHSVIVGPGQEASPVLQARALLIMTEWEAPVGEDAPSLFDVLDGLHHRHALVDHEALVDELGRGTERSAEVEGGNVFRFHSVIFHVHVAVVLGAGGHVIPLPLGGVKDALIDQQGSLGSPGFSCVREIEAGTCLPPTAAGFSGQIEGQCDLSVGSAVAEGPICLWLYIYRQETGDSLAADIHLHPSPNSPGRGENSAAKVVSKCLSCSKNPSLGQMCLWRRTVLTASSSVRFSQIMRKASTRVAERLTPIAQWTNTFSAELGARVDPAWPSGGVHNMSDSQLGQCGFVTRCSPETDGSLCDECRYMVGYRILLTSYNGPAEVEKPQASWDKVMSRCLSWSTKPSLGKTCLCCSTALMASTTVRFSQIMRSKVKACLVSGLDPPVLYGHVCVELGARVDPAWPSGGVHNMSDSQLGQRGFVTRCSPETDGPLQTPELAQEARIGADVPVAPDGVDGVQQREVLTDHEEGQHQGCRATDPHRAVDKHLPCR
ncbi:hypothetical protein SKAU_G00181580 [Synaphobranchus kaupii]|uniref:Histone acetyltransferase n=1 Tax=Synaphobranchus kaupii TaxID=118154 RepID=A0A9Q1FMQ8_SYNKA|nr:hypothetical protein SKAU_G00181580 [Synaphobranchus kaupii]